MSEVPASDPMTPFLASAASAVSNSVSASAAPTAGSWNCANTDAACRNASEKSLKLTPAAFFSAAAT